MGRPDVIDVALWDLKARLLDVPLAGLFGGSPRPSRGAIAPDLSQPGHGLVFKRRDAERFAL
jgi:L-alanine-DL-glutamate epimerase-like enolase superfamily enzyme